VAQTLINWLEPAITTTIAFRAALTVAGQWRTFTAFPNILALINCVDAREVRPWCHRIDFRDIKIYIR